MFLPRRTSYCCRTPELVRSFNCPQPLFLERTFIAWKIHHFCSRSRHVAFNIIVSLADRAITGGRREERGRGWGERDGERERGRTPLNFAASVSFLLYSDLPSRRVQAVYASVVVVILKELCDWKCHRKPQPEGGDADLDRNMINSTRSFL